MLDQIINLVKDNAGDAISNNAAIPSNLKDSAIQTTASSIFESLKSQVTGGNLGAITDLFKSGGQEGSNPIMGVINSDLVTNLTSKLGIDSSAASGMASSILPLIMSKLGSLDIQSLLGNLVGGSDLLGGLSGMLGGSDKKDGDGGGILGSAKDLLGF